MVHRFACVVVFISLSAYSQQTQYPSLVLQGSVSRTAGSLHESGNVTFVARNDGTWSESWSLDTRSFQQSSDDCKTPRTANFSCSRSVPWFAPWLASATSANGSTQQTDISNGAGKASGQRILSFSTVAQPSKTPLPQSDAVTTYRTAKTQFQVTYDLGNSLPTRMDFADYLDSGMSRKIDTYVLFSDYREESGVMVPHHIERYVQRTLQADIHITSVTTR